MTNLQRINPSDFVTVQGPFAVINEGTGYAIVNTQTQKVLAQNLISFVDCVKTLEYLTEKLSAAPESHSPTPHVQVVSAPEQAKPSPVPSFNVRPDVQHLIEKYAPTTVRVEKKVKLNRSRYKCYDASGRLLGRVQGKLGKRYWEDCERRRHY
jgi:hypothetical protein